MKTISYVFPVYNEVEGIEKFYEELIKATDKLKTYNYEFIFVNDGSRDGSREKLQSFFTVMKSQCEKKQLMDSLILSTGAKNHTRKK